ncbi:MAG: epoxyqueuosine reductase QueH [Candidatus Coprovivens sp.]
MNYNKLMEEEINKIIELGQKPKLLLHSCCAPCSTHCIKTLTPYFDITILYYNPNIEPYEEYLKRKEEEIKFINEFPHTNIIDIMDCDYDNDLFIDMSKGLENEPERGARCIKCYYLRMNKTAELAKDNNYDYFATTLTLSPLKDSKKLNEIGEKLEEKFNVKYLYSDFKKKEGYKDSIELSNQYNLYRQDYCGCKFSKRDRDKQKELKN